MDVYMSVPNPPLPTSISLNPVRSLYLALSLSRSLTPLPGLYIFPNRSLVFVQFKLSISCWSLRPDVFSYPLTSLPLFFSIRYSSHQPCTSHFPSCNHQAFYLLIYASLSVLPALPPSLSLSLSPNSRSMQSSLFYLTESMRMFACHCYPLIFPPFHFTLDQIRERLIRHK